MLLRLLIIIVMCGCVSNTIAPKEKTRRSRKSTDSKPTVKPAPIDPDSASKLSPEDLTIQAMLMQNLSHVSTPERQFHNTVLGYVTPWNNRGYDFAKQLAKFDIIVPVWYQLKRVGGQTQITGQHDTDQGWIRDVRARNPAVKIAPRLLFEGFSGNTANLQALFSSEMPQVALAGTIVSFLKENNLDGVVCEIFLQLGFSHKENAMHFLALLGAELMKNDLILIVPLPAPLNNEFQPLNFFTLADFTRLSPFVNYFNVMTYDFTVTASPGPVAPANWIAQCMLYYVKDLPEHEARKFLLGINFYGMEYFTGKRPAHLLAPRYMEILRKYPDAKLSWDAGSAGEHVLRFANNAAVAYYPTLHNLMLKLRMAEHFKCGVAIWDLGQGLDYFFNLF